MNYSGKRLIDAVIPLSFLCVDCPGYFVPERHDDATLLRFLRARKFDLAKAKLMIISAEEWRKSFGVDELVKYVR